MVTPLSAVRIETTSRATFTDGVAPHFVAVGRGDLALARSTLTTARQAALRSGVSGIPEGFGAAATARALALEAQEALASGRTDDAIELAALAQALAPSDFDTLGGVARVVVQTGGSAAMVQAVADLGRALLADPVARSQALARLLAVLIATVVLVLLAVVAAVALPTLPIVAFDLGTRLPRGVHPTQVHAFVVLVALAPLVCGVGVVVGALWIGLVALWGLDGRHRAVLALVAVSTLALPWLVVRMASESMRPAAADMALFSALYDIDGEDAVAALAKRESDGAVLDVYAQVALANAARRQGRVDEALARYRAALVRFGDVPWVRGGYAVALATAGQTQEALGEFKRVLEEARRTPDGKETAALAAFNASLLAFAAGETEQARAIVAGVPRLGPEAVARMRRATSRTVDEVVPHNRAFVEILPPRTSLPQSDDGASSNQLAAALGLWMWGSHPSSAWPVLGGLVTGIIVLGLLLRRVSTATRCTRCRAPTSRRHHAQAAHHGTCETCFTTFIAADGQVDGAARLQRENAIRRRASARARRAALLTLWPGIGHLTSGAPVRGVIGLASSTLLAVAAVMCGPWWPFPDVVGIPMVVVVSVCAAAWGLVFVVTLRSAFHIGAALRGGAR